MANNGNLIKQWFMNMDDLSLVGGVIFLGKLEPIQNAVSPQRPARFKGWFHVAAYRWPFPWPF